MLLIIPGRVFTRNLGGIRIAKELASWILPN